MSWWPFSSKKPTTPQQAREFVEEGVVNNDAAAENQKLGAYIDANGRWMSLGKTAAMETFVFWAVVAICINLVIVLISNYTGTTLPRLPDWVVFPAAAACIYFLFWTIMEPRGVLHGNGFYGWFSRPGPATMKKVEKVREARKKKKLGLDSFQDKLKENLLGAKAKSFGGKRKGKRSKGKRPKRMGVRRPKRQR